MRSLPGRAAAAVLSLLLALSPLEALAAGVRAPGRVSVPLERAPEVRLSLPPAPTRLALPATASSLAPTLTPALAPAAAVPALSAAPAAAVEAIAAPAVSASGSLEAAAAPAAELAQLPLEQASSGLSKAFDGAAPPEAAPTAVSKCPFHRMLGLSPSGGGSAAQKPSVPAPAPRGPFKFSLWTQVKASARHIWALATGKDPFHGHARPARIGLAALSLMAWRHYKNPVEGLEALHARYGDVAYAETPTGHRGFFVSDPQAVREILLNTDKNDDSPFEKSELGIGGIAKLTGRGTVFLGKRPRWEARRKAVQPHVGIKPSTREQMGVQVAAVVEDALDELASRVGGPKGAEVLVSEEMSALTMRAILEVLFGYKETTGRLKATLGPAFAEVTRTVPAESLSPLKRRLSDLPLVYPRRRQLKAAYRTLDLFAERILLQARQRKEPRGDVLDALLAAVNEDGTPVSDEDIKDEILTLVLAGHETTSATITWALHSLARRPQAKERLREELRAARALGGTPEERVRAKRYPFLGQVLDETLRLYTPAYALFRKAKRDVEVRTSRGVLFIPAGSHVTLSTFVMHRRPEQWDKTGFPAGAFHPERFDEARAKELGLKREDLQTFPFGHGPRMCMGQALSMLEAQLVLIRFLERFDFVPSRSAPAKIVSDIGVKLDDGLPALVWTR